MTAHTTRPDPHLGVVSLIVSPSGVPPLRFELASVAIGTDRPLQPWRERLISIVVVIVPLLAALHQHKSLTQSDVGGEPPPDYFHPHPLNDVVSTLPVDKLQGQQWCGLGKLLDVVPRLRPERREDVQQGRALGHEHPEDKVGVSDQPVAFILQQQHSQCVASCGGVRHVACSGRRAAGSRRRAAAVTTEMAMRRRRRRAAMCGSSLLWWQQCYLIFDIQLCFFLCREHLKCQEEKNDIERWLLANLECAMFDVQTSLDSYYLPRDFCPSSFFLDKRYIAHR